MIDFCSRKIGIRRRAAQFASLPRWRRPTFSQSHHTCSASSTVDPREAEIITGLRQQGLSQRERAARLPGQHRHPAWRAVTMAAGGRKSATWQRAGWFARGFGARRSEFGNKGNG
jgi:hypothetical protein